MDKHLEIKDKEQMQVCISSPKLEEIGGRNRSMTIKTIYIVITSDSYLDEEKLFEIQGCFKNIEDAKYLKKSLTKRKLFDLVWIEEQKLL
jgi:hypothetical protein